MSRTQYSTDDYKELWDSNEIQSLENDSERVAAIAKKMKRSESGVRNHLRIAGVQFRGRKISSVSAEEVVDALNNAYANDGGLKEAASSLDMKPSTLSAKINDMGIKKTTIFSLVEDSEVEEE